MQKNISRKRFLMKYICLVFALFPVSAMAATLEPIAGVPNKSIDSILTDATNWLLGLATGLCVLVLIWAGVNYTTSLGNQETTGKAKKMISYAILGLLVVAFSYALIKVINNILTT